MAFAIMVSTNNISGSFQIVSEISMRNTDTTKIAKSIPHYLRKEKQKIRNAFKTKNKLADEKHLY